MPRMTHWIGQYLLATSTMFALLVVVDLLRGRTFAASWTQSLAWGAASAAIFVGSRYRQARKGEACALCKDSTE
jgi:hypothetical protein